MERRAPPSRDEILGKIQQMMNELFGLPAERIQLGARLIEDLELASLDAIDVAVKVEEITGMAFDEGVLRRLRTVEHVVAALEGILQRPGATPWPLTAPQTEP